MPEIPELEAICKVLNHEVADAPIVQGVVRIPVVVRTPPKDEFASILKGNAFKQFERRGKFVLGHLKSGHTLATHLMLTGRLRLCESTAKLHAKTCWVISFENGKDLRYFGERMDGRVYLVMKDLLENLPGLKGIGPDALRGGLSFEDFNQRIRRHTGQIKGVITNEAFIAGIGNAYADEILFEARIYPFKRRTQLREEDLRRLHEAIPKVYSWAVPIVEERMGATVDEKVRDFLKVHRKGGHPCPNCGSSITEIDVNQRITSFCRKCQGGLF